MAKKGKLQSSALYCVDPRLYKLCFWTRCVTCLSSRVFLASSDQVSLDGLTLQHALADSAGSSIFVWDKRS